MYKRQQEELSCIQSYLYIQKVRYADILNYEIQAEPEACLLYTSIPAKEDAFSELRLWGTSGCSGSFLYARKSRLIS